jgi:endonuclease I
MFVSIAHAQAPVSYYSTANNLADTNLKAALNKIIENHREFNYTSSSTDVWDILKETDRDPNNAENVLLIYSGISVDAAQEYNNNKGWTREHVWAKSRGDFGTAKGPGTDVHALRPLDNTMNSIRNNRSFDNCTVCINVSDKWGNITNSKKDNNNWTFEPRNEVKGDVARMLFYMATRYEGFNNEPDLELTEMSLEQRNNEPLHGVLSTLLIWHQQDPVDDWERNRNNIIFLNYQKNRNPFIDYPELVAHIWGTKIGQNWTSGETLKLTESTNLSLQIYPNPVSNLLYIKGLITKAKVNIYDTLGRSVFASEINANSPEIDVSKLNGIYLISVNNENDIFTKYIIIQP